MAPESGFNPISHVADAHELEIFHGVNIHIPFGITKFEILIFAAAVLVFVAYSWLAKKVVTGETPKGKLWNFLEMLLIFIRDQVARPSIGEHDYKRFLPYLWTTFLFILVLNLFGMIPFLGSATASLAVTVVLALISFSVVQINGIVANHGFKGYMKTFVPHLEFGSSPLARILSFFMSAGMFVLEVMSMFIRSIVLAIRLFANMLAGHVALVVVLSFIMMAGQAAASGSNQASMFFWPITFSSVVMVTVLSLLELFGACLQAFLFTFLTAIFIGLAIHPQH